MEKPLEKEFKYYLDNQDELVKRYNGRVIVIKNEKVIGDFDTRIQAIEETSKVHTKGTFLVQLCTPGEDSHTHFFTSRVAFV